MSFKVFFECFYLSFDGRAIFISTLLRERRESGSLFHCTGPYALNALSPMVFIFISGSLSRSLSLEYLVLYREYVFMDSSCFRYDGPIPTRHLNTNSRTL